MTLLEVGRDTPLAQHTRVINQAEGRQSKQRKEGSGAVALTGRTRCRRLGRSSRSTHLAAFNILPGRIAAVDSASCIAREVLAAATSELRGSLHVRCCLAASRTTSFGGLVEKRIRLMCMTSCPLVPPQDNPIETAASSFM